MGNLHLLPLIVQLILLFIKPTCVFMDILLFVVKGRQLLYS